MIRHSCSKSFGGIRPTKTFVYFGMPISVILRGDVKSSYIAIVGREKLGLADKDITYKAVEESIPQGDHVKVAKEMFPDINPRTNRPDVDGSEFYIDSIPYSVIKGIVTPQSDENGLEVFNGEGTITIAEILDGLNHIMTSEKEGSSEEASSDYHKKSLDNISDVSDYFNEGYNRVCRSHGSVFYNLYERGELFRPVTRLEFAYILVVCSGILGGIFSTKYPMGVSFNWLRPGVYASQFTDWHKYNVSLISRDGSLCHNVKDYKGNRSMTDMLMDIKSGKSAIPLPMFMSMVELGTQGLFFYSDYALEPLKQVSRGEASFCLTQIVSKSKGE